MGQSTANQSLLAADSEKLLESAPRSLPTHEDSAEAIRSAIYSKMSPRQKWEQVFQLRQAAWAMKSAGVRALHPDWTALEVEDAVRKIFIHATT